jgi:energy-coupling factor transporter ATP-binding protein EcfA2
VFLRWLSIQNVRSIERLDMPFTAEDGDSRKWTLLLGENGCGKSTVLRAIALVLAGSDALPDLLGRPDDWLRLGASNATIEAELVTARDSQARHVRLTIHRGDTISKIFSRNQESLRDLDSAISHADRNYFVVGYGVSRRLSADPSVTVAQASSFRNPRAQNVATLFSADTVLNPLESWAMDLDYRRGKAGLSIVRDALDGLLPEATFDRIDRRRRRLLFTTSDGTLPLSALSDGYQNVAAWAGDLLFRLTETFADRKKPLETGGLLLVDELDLHLHPVWKRQLVDYLTTKLPNFQIVATTHSPLTAHQAGPGELFVLRRETPGGPPHLFQFEGEPRTLMLHQLLLSPIFGLQTVDSRNVELLRAEYRQLRGKRPLSSTDRRRLADLTEELQSLPDWSTESPSEARQRKLLEQISNAVSSTTAANGTASAPEIASVSASSAARAVEPRQTKRGATPRIEPSPRPPVPVTGALTRLS